MDTTVLEAEQLIQRWLDSVDHAQQEEEDSTAAGGSDYLSSLDWGEGEVGDNAKAVITGLMGKRLQLTATGKSNGSKSSLAAQKKGYDPRVAMEMRHREVRERRRARDERNVQKCRCDELAREVLVEAEQLVHSEERRSRAQAERDEALIQQQMTVIRRQLKVEQEAIKRQRFVENEQLERDRVSRALVQAERLVASERKRLQTRAELLRQLEEAEVEETKQGMRLVHQCFNRWWEVVLEQRAKMNKAVTVWNWGVMVRVWRAWRRYVSSRRARRERDQLARQLQRDKRLFQVAREHHLHSVCSRVLCAWVGEVHRAKEERRIREEQSLHRDKMEALLAAAARREHSNDERKERFQREQNEHNDHSKKERTETTNRPHSNKPAPSDTIVWKKARQELDHLLSTATDTHPPVREHSVSHQQQQQQQSTHTDHCGRPSQQPLVGTQQSIPIIQDTQPSVPVVVSATIPLAAAVVIRKPKTKPATKPLPMTGMENRAAAMARRKAQREERREQVEREKVERLLQEQERKRVAEMEAKEALATQRREERKKAKQLELERLARQKAMAELMSKASSHYQRSLLREKGLEPWKRFVEQCTRDRVNADQLRVRLVLRSVFGRWSRETRERVREKERQADNHRNRIMLRKTVDAWKQCVIASRVLEVKAIAVYPELLMRCVFRGWLRETRNERMKQWEKMARARRFRDRSVVHRLLKAWKQYVPLSREERLKEGRRAELRRKVASWLQDYQPRDN